MTWSVVNDGDGLPRIKLTEPGGSSAEVLLYGGQIISWKNDRREELLFISSKIHLGVDNYLRINSVISIIYYELVRTDNRKISGPACKNLYNFGFDIINEPCFQAVLKSPYSIRGGIPICFPQFGDFGNLATHGFARNRLWALDSCPSPLPPSRSNSSVDLILKSTDEDLRTWPRSFELRLRIILSPGKLTLIPRVRNTDSKPFSFTFALRNYLSVSDVSEVRVEGLETLDYFDNLMKGERFTEQADAITFDGEVDRVYLSTPSKIAIIDHEKKRTLVLRKGGLIDAVVWNPWDKKSKALPDFGDEDYKSMLCVDSAFIENRIHLKPNEEWKGWEELSTVPSSYCSGQLDPCKVLYG